MQVNSVKFVPQGEYILTGSADKVGFTLMHMFLLKGQLNILLIYYCFCRRSKFGKPTRMQFMSAGTLGEITLERSALCASSQFVFVCVTFIVL